jgi:tRNA(Glu) U13 pseudouridine synthase TruD
MTLGFVLSAGTYATTLLQEIAAQVIDLGPDAAPVYSEPEDEPSTGE